MIYLLSQGNLVNLAAGDGSLIEVMDLGLALQLLSLAYLAKNADSLAFFHHDVLFGPSWDYSNTFSLLCSLISW